MHKMTGSKPYQWSARSHSEKLLIIAAVLALVLLYLGVDFFRVDPHSLAKYQYYGSHAQQNLSASGWNSHVRCGAVQHDQVFWLTFPFLYTLISSQACFLSFILLGSWGIYLVLKSSHLGVKLSILASFIYALSCYFLQFLPIWEYGWRIVFFFFPWQFFLMIKLKTKGKLYHIAILGILTGFSLLVYETFLLYCLLMSSFLYICYSFFDFLDYHSGIRHFGEFMWKVLLGASLGFCLAAPAYIPALQIETDLFLSYLNWKLTVFVIITVFLLFLISLKKKEAAVWVFILILLSLNLYVVINYLPGLAKYNQYGYRNNWQNYLTEHLKKDTGEFRIFALGEEFEANRWSREFSTIGGEHRYSSESYNTLLKECLAVEIDKDLEINWNLLQMLNVKYLVSRLKIPSPRLEYASFSYEEQLILYKIKAENPYAWYARAWEKSTPEEIKSLLCSPQFDISSLALSLDDLSEYSETGTFLMANDSKITIQRRNSEYLQIHSKTDQPALMIISELFDQRWQAYIDGLPVRQYKINLILRGLAVPAGEHLVEMKYHIKQLEYWDKISYAARLLILILILAEILYALVLRLY